MCVPQLLKALDEGLMSLETRKNQQEHEEVETDEEDHPNEKEDESAHGHGSARDREVTTIWTLHPNERIDRRLPTFRRKDEEGKKEEEQHHSRFSGS
jgi:hypothetical protein